MARNVREPNQRDLPRVSPRVVRRYVDYVGSLDGWTESEIREEFSKVKSDRETGRARGHQAAVWSAVGDALTLLGDREVLESVAGEARLLDMASLLAADLNRLLSDPADLKESKRR